MLKLLVLTAMLATTVCNSYELKIEKGSQLDPDKEYFIIQSNSSIFVREDRKDHALYVHQPIERNNDRFLWNIRWKTTIGNRSYYNI